MGALKPWVVALLSVAGLVALTGPASADPITLITTAIYSFFLSSGLAVGINAIGLGIYATAQVVATALVVGGVVAANFLLGPRPGALPTINPGGLKEVFEEPEGPEIHALGRVRVSGLKAYGNTRDFDRYRLICHFKGEMEAIEDYFLDGREILVDQDTGAVTTPPYNLVDPPFSYIFIKSKVGDGTETAWDDLLTDFAGLWTTDHRVRGIAQSLVRYSHPGLTSEAFMQMYQGGPPTLNIVCRAQKNIYDPRTETYGWTDNGILCALHVLLTFPEFTLDDFDLDFIADQADAADALVATLTGTEKRSRCWGFFTSEMPRGDLMDQLLRSIGAELVSREEGEKIGIKLIDDDPESELTIPTRHIVELDWRAGPESVERPNICRVKYYSPERNYEMTEIALHEFDATGEYVGPAWARIQDEIDRVGDQPYDVELPFCPSASQAQRIARRLFALSRGDACIARTNMAGLAVWGARYVSFEFPDDIGTKLAAIAPPRVNDKDATVEIPFVAWPTLAAWVPATDEVAAPDQLPEFVYDTDKTTPDMPTAATVVRYDGSPDHKETRLAFNFPAGEAFAELEASYRTVDGENLSVWFGMTEVRSTEDVSPSSDYYFAWAAVDLIGQVVRFRVRYFLAGQGSAWSPTLEVTLAEDNTAPDAPKLDVVYDAGPPEKITVTATVGTNLNVSTIEFTWDQGTPPIVLQDVRPGDVVTFDIEAPATGITHNFTVQTFTSNGTGSAITSNFVIVP